MSEAKREPLFHISKRTDISWQKALLIRVKSAASCPAVAQTSEKSA